MADGATRLCMPPPDPELLRQAIIEMVRLEREWIPSAPGTSLYIRPAMFATEPFLGVRPANNYLLFIIASPVGAYYAEGMGPVKIRIEDRYVRAAPGGLGAVKAAANYVASLMAAEEAKKAGYAQVLWTDALEHAALEEVGTMNLFVRIGEEFATPALNGTILGGVTRDSVITLLRRWGHADQRTPHPGRRAAAGQALGRAERGVRHRHRRGDLPRGRARLERSALPRRRWASGRDVAEAVHRDHRHPVRPRSRSRRLDDDHRVAPSPREFPRAVGV